MVNTRQRLRPIHFGPVHEPFTNYHWNTSILVAHNSGTVLKCCQKTRIANEAEELDFSFGYPNKKIIFDKNVQYTVSELKGANNRRDAERSRSFWILDFFGQNHCPAFQVTHHGDMLGSKVRILSSF